MGQKHTFLVQINVANCTFSSASDAMMHSAIEI